MPDGPQNWGSSSQHSIDGTKQRCLSVIVPIYNESDVVEELLRRVECAPVEKQIILVDDGSTDGTLAKLLAVCGLDVTVVSHERNFGKGAAIRTGLRYAKGEYVVIQDSDLEYDPQDYQALMEPLKQRKANVVYGVRPDRPGRGIFFFVGAKLLTFLSNLLYEAKIHDEATCYKAFRRSLLARMPLDCRGFEFCPEVTAKLRLLGETIHEVAISYRPRRRTSGKKVRYRDGWQAIWTLISLRLRGRPQLLEDNIAPDLPGPFAIKFARVPSPQTIRM